VFLECVIITRAHAQAVCGAKVGTMAAATGANFVRKESAAVLISARQASKDSEQAVSTRYRSKEGV
jgi:hypothetical protein